jgi:hypothetical protein
VHLLRAVGVRPTDPNLTYGTRQHTDRRLSCVEPPKHFHMSSSVLCVCVEENVANKIESNS